MVAVIALRQPDASRTASPASDMTSQQAPTGRPSPSGSPTGPASTPRSSTPAVRTTPAATPSTAAAGGTAAKSVPLVVLNNTTTQGLAAQAATRFEAGGWTVTSSGNLTNNIVSTCAYYDPNAAGAKAAAEALKAQYPTIKRVAPKFAELPAGPVVVVLTPDYTAN